MLLTQRWRGDPTEASVDPDRDGNAFSFYFHSRLDIGLPDGERFVCEELRDGCPGLTSNDGWRGVRPIRHRPIVLVRVYVDRRLVLTRRGRALHSVPRARPGRQRPAPDQGSDVDPPRADANRAPHRVRLRAPRRSVKM